MVILSDFDNLKLGKMILTEGTGRFSKKAITIYFWVFSFLFIKFPCLSHTRKKSSLWKLTPFFFRKLKSPCILIGAFVISGISKIWINWRVQVCRHLLPQALERIELFPEPWGVLGIVSCMTKHWIRPHVHGPSIYSHSRDKTKTKTKT